MGAWWEYGVDRNSQVPGYTLNPETERAIHIQAIESFTGSWVTTWVPTANGPGPSPQAV